MFFRQWLRAPLRTASIVPSGKQLGRIMVRAARLAPGQRILELGGGTGALTQALLSHGVAAESLDVIEYNPNFARALRRRFPAVRIVEADAASMTAAMPDRHGSYAAVISGLPLLAMNAETQTEILSETLTLLQPGGAIIQFTYSPLSPLERDVARRLGLRATRVGVSVRNVPPAWVFRIERQS